MTEAQLKRAQEVKRKLDEEEKIIKILSGGYKNLTLTVNYDIWYETVGFREENASKKTIKKIHALLMADARERKERLKKEFEAL